MQKIVLVALIYEQGSIQSSYPGFEFKAGLTKDTVEVKGQNYCPGDEDDATNKSHDDKFPNP